MKKTIRQKQFAGLIVAGLLARLVNVSGDLVDSFVVGRFCGGADALAAVNVISPLITFSYVIASMNKVTSSAIASRSLAVMDSDKATSSFNLAISITTATSLVLTLICILFPERVIDLLTFGKDIGGVYPQACAYLIGFAPSFMFLSLNSVLVPFLGLDGCRKRLRLFTLSILATNFILDFCVAFFFEGNLMYIGLATSVATFAGFAVLASHLFDREGYFLLRLKFTQNQFTDYIKSAPVAFPSAIREASHALRKLIINTIIIGLAASCGLAAVSIQGRFSSLVAIFIYGVSEAVFVLSGMSYTRSSRAELKDIFAISFKYFKILLLISAAMLVFSPWLAKLFLNDAEVYPFALFAVCSVAIDVPFRLINSAYRHYMQGSKRASFASALSFLDDMLVIPCALMLAPSFGLKGVLAALPMSSALQLLLIYSYIAIHSKKLFVSMDDILLLPDYFGLNIVEEKSWELKDLDTVMSCSENCYDFFLSHGVDRKYCYYLSLFVEESAKNTLKHGFKDLRPHLIRMTASYKSDGECQLYLEDDCRRFDPIQKRALMHELKSDGPQHIGLKLICGLAEEIKYINTMNTNTVMVTYKSSVEV